MKRRWLWWLAVDFLGVKACGRICFFENSAGALDVAEPHGAHRLELVVEGGIGARMKM